MISDYSLTYSRSSGEACTSTASVHHRPPSSAPTLSNARKLALKGSNGYTRSYEYPSYASGNSFGNNGFANGIVATIDGGTLSRSGLNGVVEKSPYMECIKIFTNELLYTAIGIYFSYSSHTSGLGGSPPRPRRSPQSHKVHSNYLVRIKEPYQFAFNFLIHRKSLDRLLSKCKIMENHGFKLYENFKDLHPLQSECVLLLTESIYR
uniref:Uncharacterized protein n=1 Tax=Heterorhabditis bacteriophora TaxID=37862 RepID=A0A1I7WW01_HETBA